MTLKYWTASPLKLKPASPPPSLETLVLHNHLRSMTRADASTAAAPAPRVRSLSSTWNDLDSGADMDAFDASATLPAPSLVSPATWISGRRRPSTRHHGRCRRRHRNNSNSSDNQAAAGLSVRATPSATPMSSSLSSTLSSTLTSSTSSSPTSDDNNNNNNKKQAKEEEAPPRLRVLAPSGSRLLFGGWERGQPADVRWEPLDKRVQFVRIDVCNEAWTVPTTIAHRAPNDGAFRWRRVYWGMPIADGYFVNVYDATEQTSATDELPLLAQSERFSVVR